MTLAWTSSTMSNSSGENGHSQPWSKEVVGEAEAPHSWTRLQELVHLYFLNALGLVLQKHLCGLCLPWVLKGHFFQQSSCLHFPWKSWAQMWWLPHMTFVQTCHGPSALTSERPEILSQKPPPRKGPLVSCTWHPTTRSHLCGPRNLCPPIAGLGLWAHGVLPKPAARRPWALQHDRLTWKSVPQTVPTISGPLVLPAHVTGVGSSRRLLCWLRLNLNLHSH